jgi:hypothetical protein
MVILDRAFGIMGDLCVSIVYHGILASEVRSGLLKLQTDIPPLTSILIFLLVIFAPFTKVGFLRRECVMGQSTRLGVAAIR